MAGGGNKNPLETLLLIAGDGEEDVGLGPSLVETCIRDKWSTLLRSHWLPAGSKRHEVQGRWHSC